MKALTNILNYILLLMMILIASCTEDTAEVDDLVRGEEYVTVRMHVPGMKSATTRAEAEDNITSVWALTYRNTDSDDKLELVSKTEVITTATTGYFNIPRPQSGDVIHFLANLPNEYSLPEIDSEESKLCALTTTDDENLSYWGTATYTSGEDLSVTLYRNMAKIEIAPVPNECTFPEDRLFIAGLVKPIEKGTLVPYQDGFNFDLDNYDYYTLPSSLIESANRTNKELSEPVKSLYLFEHNNPGTANGLYVICKIEDDYYKVALIDEDKEPYPIIRNHRYVIYVNDLDYGADSFNAAVLAEPVNFVVREYKNVTLTLLPSSVTLDYTKSNPSASKLSLTVGGIENVVETLTFNAPGFTIQPGDGAAATAENGVFKITNTSKESIGFTFTLTDPNEVGSISVTGAGKYVNEITPASTPVTLNLLKESIEVTPTTSTLYYDSDEPQVVTVNVTVPDGVKTLTIGGAEKFEVMQGDNPLTATEGVYSYTVTDNSNPIPFTFTLNQQNVTEEQVITFSGDNVNAASVTISMAQTPVVTFSPDESSKTMSVNDTYTITMTVPNNGTLSALSIAAEGFTVASSSVGLTGPTDNVYSYTGGTTTFTFTPTSAGDKTIRFYDGEGVNINVPEKEISVKVEEASSSVNLEITSPSQAHATIDLGSYNSWEEKSITMQLRIPAGVKQVTFGGESINDFTISTDSGNFNNNVYTNNNSSSSQEVTFTIKIGANASLGEHIINISGTGDGITVNGTQMVVTITQTVFGVTPTTTEISNTNSYVDLTIVKPKALTQLCFVISDNNMLMATGNEDHDFQCNNSIYYFYNSPTMEEVIRIKLRDDKTITEEKECTISFYEGSSTSGSAKTVTITLKP